MLNNLCRSVLNEFATIDVAFTTNEYEKHPVYFALSDDGNVLYRFEFELNYMTGFLSYWVYLPDTKSAEDYENFTSFPSYELKGLVPVTPNGLKHLTNLLSLYTSRI